jgi:hypothetical protein
VAGDAGIEVTGLLQSLVGQLDAHWRGQLRPHLEGMTDEEYLWEPAPDCWTIRPHEKGFIADWAWPAPEPAPFTTIAWRLFHMAGPCLDMRTRELFGGETVDWDTYPTPGTVADCLALLDDGYARWTSAIRALGDERILEPMGPNAGEYAAEPFLGIVLHNNRELIHHGAEVALLRDLYRARR